MKGEGARILDRILKGKQDHIRFFRKISKDENKLLVLQYFLSLKFFRVTNIMKKNRGAGREAF
ncbi:hypothetical protein DNK57_01950 [Methanothermobacter thermautotrophicus]|uniref:Uncharacterized protein n=1 Tax=Methanothermobacter thermautotrophicus TaxID=145262 RepID=A0A842YN73_METTF|nr:hypothetical protein [Methanothermobacter thermautotrophicus]